MDKKIRTAAALGAAVAVVLSAPLFVPAAQAALSGDGVVINEVYARGGSKGASFKNKFVELYNPTAKAVSLDGLALGYVPKAGNKVSASTALSGEIPAGGYYVVSAGSNGSEGADSPADAKASFNIGGDGSVVLAAADKVKNVANGGNSVGVDGVVDEVGWGSGTFVEQTGAVKIKGNAASYSRTDGVDTDNNSADFTEQEATPGEANAADGQREEPAPVATGAPAPAPEPSAAPTSASAPSPSASAPAMPAAAPAHTIAEIQGTGEASPFAGQTVTTRGVVTAVYPEGGFNGVYIQTPGNTWDGKASTGLFVFSKALAAKASIGAYVEVTGKVSEFYNLTELSASTFSVLPDKVPAPAPQKLEAVPSDEGAREALEGMLVQITGPYTVTDNYSTNQFGTVGLASGNTPLVQPSDVYNPTTQMDKVKALEAANAARAITLDDGRSQQYLGSKGTADVPLPCLSKENPVRAGAAVTFHRPLILDFRHGWNLQPTQPASTKAGGDVSSNFVTFENTRKEAPKVGGNVSLATFNVLNYFTSLGQDDAGASSYKDREGNPITVNRGKVRGAWSEASFKRQQDKIVNAINQLDASVVSLEEIENSRSVDASANRDESLAKLVAALNEAAGKEKWAFVPSPAAADLPAKEDVIRLAFIYQKDAVKPVGASLIHDSAMFQGVARQPLAQKFRAADGSGKVFVVVANHFKSKGSLSTRIADDTDAYQGNNNKLRTAEAKEVAAFVAQHFAGEPVFLVGDFNSYSKEDPIIALEQAGYSNVADIVAPGAYTYQFDGKVGSLDHVLANDAAKALVDGGNVWNINAMESVALEYSRFNYNVKNLYDSTPFRSSDHDPFKIGINTKVDESAVAEPSASAEPTGEPTAAPTQEPTAAPEPAPTAEPAPSSSPEQAPKPAPKPAALRPSHVVGGAQFYSNDWKGGEAAAVDQYGRLGDQVFFGDWDGDGIDTPGVRRGSQFLLTNKFSGPAEIVFSFGKPSDGILVGDWDGDGKDTIAVRRGNEVLARDDLAGGNATASVHFGRAWEQVLVGDWDGNGRDELAIRRGSSLYLQDRFSAPIAGKQFDYGRPMDQVVAGDWDGDGKDTFAVIRLGHWFGKNSLTGGAADFETVYGTYIDVPYVGDWDGNGTDTPAVAR